MKKSSIWIGLSVGLLSTIANAQVNSTSPEKMGCEDKGVVGAAQVRVNSDGSAHLVGSNGKSIFIKAEILDNLKTLNPGQTATYQGSTPCVGKSNANTTLNSKGH